MKISILASFCVLLTAGWALFFARAKAFYDRPDHYIAKIELLNKKVKKEKLRHLFTQYEFEGFRQHVATLLPGVIEQKGKGEKSYPYRSLASVVHKSNSDELNQYGADQIFKSAKESFRQRRFHNAIKQFNVLIQKHSYSAHIPESLFLKLESHYQVHEFSHALAAYESLVDLYPTSELTGYAMIRVGKIYESEKRFDDATDIYRNVLAVFPQPEIASLAREQMKASGL